VARGEEENLFLASDTAGCFVVDDALGVPGVVVGILEVQQPDGIVRIDFVRHLERQLRGRSRKEEVVRNLVRGDVVPADVVPGEPGARRLAGMVDELLDANVGPDLPPSVLDQRLEGIAHFDVFLVVKDHGPAGTRNTVPRPRGAPEKRMVA
jgi:hypothetical protein